MHGADKSYFVSKGVFFKGNVGYAWFFNSIGDGLASVTIDEDHDGNELSRNDDKIANSKNSGGLYFGIGAGYEFSNGLILDVTGRCCNTSCSYDDSDSSHRWKCWTRSISINVGCNLMKLWDTLSN